MVRNWMKMVSAPVLALALVVAGCDGLSDLSGPALQPERPAHLITIAKETSCATGTTVTATVGVEGGNLAVCKHFLTIPAGAVSGPTVFVMKKLDSEIKVDLSATSVGSTVTNDVGAKGFLKPLTLTLNYQNATTLPADQSSLRIYWIKPDGTKVEEVSTVNTSNKSVTSNPTHFSEYGIGWPNFSLQLY